MTAGAGAHPIAAAFAARCAARPLVLSGGLGSELGRRGAPLDAPLWSTAAMVARPDLVRDVHRRYVLAGARVVVANTFRTARHTLAKVGRAKEARALTAQAVRLAREGIALARPTDDDPVFVAGSIAPLEDCCRPERTPDETTRRIEHGVHVGSLVAAGVTLAWVETMPTVREAVSALEAARAGALPAVVSFVVAPGARLLSGEPLAEAVAAVEPLSPLAILVNCCAPPVATEALAVLRATTARPVGVYANGRGQPAPDGAWSLRGGTRDRAYARAARGWHASGARLLGGCCGTTPRTIRRLARGLARHADGDQPPSAATSPTGP